MSRLVALALSTLAFVLAPASSEAQTLGVPGQEIVFLLKDCAGAGHTLGTDCFQTVAALQDYIWGSGQRNPSASSPLIVDIGAGEFTGNLVCPSGGHGHVTFRGVGRERTVLKGSAGSVESYTVRATDCERLEFMDLAIQAPTSGTFIASVAWDGIGTSTYTDVDLIMRGVNATDTGAAWWDFDEASSGRAVHYWFGCRVFSEGDSRALIAFYSAGNDQHWFYGGDIKAEGTADTPANADQFAVEVLNAGDVRLYGSTVRSLVGDAVTSSYSGILGLVGILALGPFTTPVVHMHGGIIVADASGSQVDVDVIGALKQSAPQGRIHVLETAFNVAAGQNGTAQRVKGGVQSPFSWPKGSTPPSVVSETGADTFVETDCTDTECSSGTGQETHLMIYNTSCGSDPWFDTVTGACRQ